MGREHSSEMETTPPSRQTRGGGSDPLSPRGRRVATCGPRLSPLSRPGTHNALPAATPSFTRGRRGGLCVCVCVRVDDRFHCRTSWLFCRGSASCDRPTAQNPRVLGNFSRKTILPGFESAHRASKLPHEPSEIIY